MQKPTLLLTLLLLLALVAACGAEATQETTPGALPGTGAEETAPPAGEAITGTVETAPTEVMTATPEAMATEVVSPTAEAMATEAISPTAEAGETPGAGGMSGELRTPQEAALEAAGGQELGGSVSVLAVWGGSEQETFMAMIEPFEEATGITVEYEGTRNLNAVLTTRVQGGNPPDLAGLPGPGQMAELARAGALVDLSDVLDQDRFGKEYASTWSDLGTVDDQLVGIFIKASVKGLIWYNPQVWQAQGFEQPETWDELMSLSQQMADTGTTPWCVALENAAASGWPGTDWLEDIVLRQSGLDVYTDWYEGKIKWSSPEIRQAWETWGEIVADPNMVYGGANSMLTTSFGNVGDPLFTDPPGCYMAHQASFITSFFQENTPGVEPVTDFDFFGFPDFDASAAPTTIIAGDLFGMFNDTPQARALINYLTTPEAQAIWVERGGAISPNQSVPLDLYPDEMSRKAAERLTSAEVVAFDASDLMPEAMNNAFWRAILDYVQDPASLDSILEQLDTVQEDAYQQGQ